MRRDQRELIAIHQQILDAKDAVEAERARDVLKAREDVRRLLGQHGLFTASFATRRDPHGTALFVEFHRMADKMRNGGFHCVRLTGGRKTYG